MFIVVKEIDYIIANVLGKKETENCSVGAQWPPSSTSLGDFPRLHNSHL